MLDVVVLVLLAVVLPVIINKTTERGYFHWITPHLRTVWTAVLTFFTAYVLAKPAVWGTVTKLHSQWSVTIGYLVAAASGAALLCFYWWLSGAMLNPAGQGEARDSAAAAANEKPPTLVDLFTLSFPAVMKVDGNRWGLVKQNEQVTSGSTKVYLDFDAKTKFIAFYVPRSQYSYEAAVGLWSQVETTFAAVEKSVAVQAGYGHNPTDLKDLTFSGRVFLYHEDNFNLRQLADLVDAYKAHGMALDFRGPDYLGSQVIAWHQQHEAKVKK